MFEIPPRSKRVDQQKIQSRFVCIRRKRGEQILGIALLFGVAFVQKCPLGRAYASMRLRSIVRSLKIKKTV
jgi:hypothetical protein